MESSHQQLKNKTSLKEILEVAIEFERTARDFYQEMIPKVSKRIRYIVEDLADEEQVHFDLFSSLNSRADIQAEISQMVETPVNDTKFSDCIHLPELGENPDDQAILQYALMREQTAIEQYASLAESSQPSDIKSLFEFLANEETKHKVELEKVYYEVVHSGGV
jgi:rubrerythrin